MGFENFCDSWVKIYRELNEKGANDTEKTRRFEELFFRCVLISFVPEGCRIERNKRIKGIEYEFDFLITRRDASQYYVRVGSRRAIAFSPNDVLAAVEVKSHGFFNHEKIERFKYAFKSLEKNYPQIELYYITIGEPDYYGKEARSSFGSDLRWHYRLSDRWDNVCQMSSAICFHNEWDRLMVDLLKLKESKRPHTDRQNC